MVNWWVQRCRLLPRCFPFCLCPVWRLNWQKCWHFPHVGLLSFLLLRSVTVWDGWRVSSSSSGEAGVRPVTAGTLSRSHIVSPTRDLREIPRTSNHPTEFNLIIKYFPEFSVTVNLLKYYQAETSFNMTRSRSASTSLKLETDEDIKAEDLEV